MTSDDLLFDACKNGHLKTVNELIDRFLVFKLKPKANVNARDGDGFTPLCYAARDGHRSIVQKLIDKGADVNAKDITGFTPLFFAVWQGHVDIVKLLVAKGADVNAKDTRGFNPSRYAIDGGHKDIARFLASKGSAVSAKNKTALALVSPDAATRKTTKLYILKGDTKTKGKPVATLREITSPKVNKEVAISPVSEPSQHVTSDDPSWFSLDQRLAEVSDVNDFIFDERDRLLAGDRRRDDSTAVVWDLLHKYNLFRGQLVCDHIGKARGILMYATGESGGLPNMVGEICGTTEGATLVIGGDLRNKADCWFDLVELLSKKHKELGIVEASFYDMIGETSIIIEQSPRRRLSNIGKALDSRNSKPDSLSC